MHAKEMLALTICCLLLPVVAAAETAAPPPQNASTKDPMRIPPEVFCASFKKYLLSPNATDDLALLEKCALKKESEVVCNKNDVYHTLLNSFAWAFMQAEHYCDRNYSEFASARSRYGNVMMSLAYGTEVVSKNLTLFDPELMPYVNKLLEDLSLSMVGHFNSTISAMYGAAHDKLKPAYTYLKWAGGAIAVIVSLTVIGCTTYCIYRQGR